VIAQEVEKIFPEVVSENKNASGAMYKSVQYGNLVAPLIESTKELSSLHDAQQREIDTLRSENEALKKRLDAIEARLGK
jgi:hypothetical protein